MFGLLLQVIVLQTINSAIIRNCLMFCLPTWVWPFIFHLSVCLSVYLSVCLCVFIFRFALDLSVLSSLELSSPSFVLLFAAVAQLTSHSLLSSVYSQSSSPSAHFTIHHFARTEISGTRVALLCIFVYSAVSLPLIASKVRLGRRLRYQEREIKLQWFHSHPGRKREKKMEWDRQTDRHINQRGRRRRERKSGRESYFTFRQPNKITSGERERERERAVSYTHLTLPTRRWV